MPEIFSGSLHFVAEALTVPGRLDNEIEYLAANYGEIKLRCFVPRLRNFHSSFCGEKFCDTVHEMLSDIQLSGLLGASENRLIERKASKPNDREVRKTLVAFANSVSEGEHGVMFIGVGDDGRILGVPNVDAVQRDIRRIAENDCFPPVRCEPQSLPASGVEIVAIVVPPSSNRPHFTGHAYVRCGSESVKSSGQMFDEMVASRNDKARKILAHKFKTISVRFTGHNHSVQGSMERGFVAREWRDYRIDYCDAHYVKFIDLASGHIYTPSLEHVVIEFDSQAHRLRLVVTEV